MSGLFYFIKDLVFPVFSCSPGLLFYPFLQCPLKFLLLRPPSQLGWCDYLQTTITTEERTNQRKLLEPSLWRWHLNWEGKDEDIQVMCLCGRWGWVWKEFWMKRAKLWKITWLFLRTEKTRMWPEARQWPGEARTSNASETTTKGLAFIPGTMGNQLDGFRQGVIRSYLCFKITVEGNTMETERTVNGQLELSRYAITVAWMTQQRRGEGVWKLQGSFVSNIGRSLIHWQIRSGV